MATYAYGLYGSELLPLDQALRVVLSRLGNFPSIATSEPVAKSLRALPLSLAAEEIAASEENRINISDQSYYLTNFQHKLWTHLQKGSKVAVVAPTSAGKSFVLEVFLTSLFSATEPCVVVYVVPTRALITQVAHDLADHFSSNRPNAPELLTMPVDASADLPSRAIYIFTQERLQLALTGHSAFLAHTVVVDEAHSVQEGARGILLHWVIEELLRRDPEAQVLFASPTVRNPQIFGRLFGLSEIVECVSDEPTVGQSVLLVDVEGANTGKIAIRSVGATPSETRPIGHLTLKQVLASRIDKLVHIPAALGRDQSSIIYANGAAEAENIAMQLADLFSDRPSNAHLEALADLVAESVHNRYVLVKCVRAGVGFHYSHIPTLVRKAVETAFKTGHLKYLVCTSTLLQGVNLPARNIFMCLPERGHGKPLESADFWNLAGRAGRLRHEFNGNIFLIDYSHWKKRPLDGPKDQTVVPAISDAVVNHERNLVGIISNEAAGKRTPSDMPLEAAFAKLFFDYKTDGLRGALSRAGLSDTARRIDLYSSALEKASTRIRVPLEVLQRSPSISPHRQQSLCDYLLKEVLGAGPEGAGALVPAHPRERDVYYSYRDILKLCHDLLLGMNPESRLHTFHAVMAIKWMSGRSLPQIIEEQLRRRPGKDPRAVIRDTLEVIEDAVRFQTLRLIACYISILRYVLETSDRGDLAANIPSLPLFLEVGATDRTMVSFIVMGLSRTTAMKLNIRCPQKNLGVDEARQWLLGQNMDTLGLSPLLGAEAMELLRKDRSANN